MTDYDHLLGNAVKKELRLLSNQRFGNHMFVTTNNLHGFPWIRASPYNEPWRLQSFVRQTDVVQGSERFWIQIRQTAVVIHPEENSEGV
jgi:hypothetical protein